MLLGLTVTWREDIISSVQTQHWHLHRIQLVDRTGIKVVVIVGRITKHYGGEPLIKLSDGPCLKGQSNCFNCIGMYRENALKHIPYLHYMIDVVTLFKYWSMSGGEKKRQGVKCIKGYTNK